MSETRFNCRVKTFLLVHINGNTYGKILDISAGGVLLSDDALLSVDNAVALEIYLPNHRFKAIGKVVRKAGEKEYGIQFVDPSEQDKVKITEYISKTCKATIS